MENKNENVANEVQRIVIRDILIHNGPNDYIVGNQIWAYREDGQPWKSVDKQLQMPYSIISQLCSSRAIEVELRNILCDGMKTRAEHYLGLWRESAKASISNADLVSRGGYITLTIKRQKALFEEAARKQHEPQALEALGLLNRSDCLNESPTVTWALKLDNLEALQAYEKITNIYCGDEQQPGQHSIKASLYIPDDFFAGNATESKLNTVPAGQAQYQLEI